MVAENLAWIIYYAKNNPDRYWEITNKNYLLTIKF